MNSVIMPRHPPQELKEYIVSVATHLPCSAVALIFESSERGHPLVQQHFGELGLHEGDHALPIEHCFMPKSPNGRGSELADFEF
jgi:hypothetical protein